MKHGRRDEFDKRRGKTSRQAGRLAVSFVQGAGWVAGWGLARRNVRNPTTTATPTLLQPLSFLVFQTWLGQIQGYRAELRRIASVRVLRLVREQFVRPTALRLKSLT